MLQNEHGVANTGAIVGYQVRKGSQAATQVNLGTQTVHGGGKMGSTIAQNQLKSNGDNQPSLVQAMHAIKKMEAEKGQTIRADRHWLPERE